MPENEPTTTPAAQSGQAGQQPVTGASTATTATQTSQTAPNTSTSAQGQPAASQSDPEAQAQQTVTNPEAQKYAAEAAANRKALREAEKRIAEYEAAQKAADDAKLSEVERASKRAADAERQLADRTRAFQERIISSDIQLNAAKLGIIDPDAAAKLLDWSGLEYDEDGLPTNATALLEQLLTAKPYLRGAGAANGVNASAPVAQQLAQASQGQQQPNIAPTNAARATGPLGVTPDQYLSKEYRAEFRKQYGQDLTQAVTQGKAKII